MKNKEKHDILHLSVIKNPLSMILKIKAEYNESLLVSDS